MLTTQTPKLEEGTRWEIVYPDSSTETAWLVDKSQDFPLEFARRPIGGEATGFIHHVCVGDSNSFVVEDNNRVRLTNWHIVSGITGDNPREYIRLHNKLSRYEGAARRAVN